MHAWQLLGTWTFDPLPAAGIIVAAVAYCWAAVAVSRRQPGRPWPKRRTASFLGGLVLTWIVLLGPIGAYDDVFFWAHMVQHIALMMVIAPLLLLGSPVLLLLRVTRPAARRRWIVPVLRSRAVYVLTGPVLTWVLFAGVLLYLGVALLYYYPLLDANPCRRFMAPELRVLSLGLMMVPETLTGFFIYASNYVLYPFYTTVSRPFGPGPLADQQIGGVLMWAGGMVIDTGWLALACAAWLRSDRVKTRRLDAQIARSLRVTH